MSFLSDFCAVFLATPTTACVEWTGSLDVQGYGVIYVNRVRKYAHRLIYELLVEKITDGMTIDHLCFNHACVNPNHLEAVTGAINVSRAAYLRVRTHCKKGHLFTSESEKWNGKTRQCNICHKQYKRGWEARRRELPQ